MSQTLHTPALAAYAAGKPILPIGHLPNGRPVFPIAGGADDPPAPQRPEGVTEEEWTALGDPGRRAIVREREARVKAEQDLRAAKTPKPGPPPAPAAPAPVATPPAPGAPGDQPDVAKLIADGIAAAIKPFEEREQQRAVAEKAAVVRDAVLKAAESRFHDATDALGNVDLTAVIDEQGVADAAKITAALDAALAAKPHLAKATSRVAPPYIGGGTGGVGASEADQVKALLSQMQTTAGVRPPAAASS